MKATLFFKKIDYNQITTKNPVCTMHNPDTLDMDNEWQKPYDKINYEKSCEKITNYILKGHV